MNIQGHAPIQLLKRSLDVYAKQHHAIADNVSNTNNPEYTRQDTDFSAMLTRVNAQGMRISDSRHLGGNDVNRPLSGIAGGEPVDLTREMGDLAVNQLHFDFSAMALRRMYQDIMSSITGRTG